MWPKNFVPKFLLMLTLQNLRWPILCSIHLAIASPLSPYKFNEKFSGKRLVYGDILLSPRQVKLSRLLKTGQMAKHIALKAKQNNRWPHNEIPFIFSVKFNERQKHAIREALAVLEDNSCFRFIRRTNQRDFLFIDMQEGCFSFVGKVGGRQLLSLAAGCLHDYIIWHEVMHALGLEHEHQRPDRDKFIRIHWKNVEPDKHLNFEKIPHNDVDLYHTYDYHSLMHYDGTAFGRTDPDTGEPMTTMEPLRDGVELTDNFELTKFDVEKLQILSKCDQKRRKKLHPGMEPKLITDPGSVEQKADCSDRSPNCATLKKNGFCWEIRYVRLIRIQCQHTCGLCENEYENAGKKPAGQIRLDNRNQGQGIVKEGGQNERENAVIGLDNTNGQDNQDYDNQNGAAEWDYGNGMTKTGSQEMLSNGNGGGQQIDKLHLDKTGGQNEENYGKQNGQDWDYTYENGIDERHNNVNNTGDGIEHGSDGIGTKFGHNGNANIIKPNGEDKQKQSKSDLMDKQNPKKKKKKLLLIKTSDEELSNSRKRLNKVDEHYTKWKFPKGGRRPNGDGEDEDEAIKSDGKKIVIV